jgi:hypothetical protein
VHAKASAGVRVRGGVIDTGLARHGVETDGAAALRSAPWVAAVSTAAAGLEREWERRLVAKRALAGLEGGAPSSASACARQPAKARPWRRGRRGVRAGGPAQEKGQRPSLTSRVTVHACWGARLREGVAARTDTRANANATRTRTQCEYAGNGARVTKTGWLPTARGARLGRQRARWRRWRHLQENVSQPGSMAGITSCGAAARSNGRSALARCPWRPQEERNGRSHPGGHWPKWSASVK